MKKLRLAVLVLFGFGYAVVSQATIYEWVEQGVPTFSDSVPSVESGMGGHYHGPYTEGGVRVSVSFANPATLQQNAASNAHYMERQRTSTDTQNVPAFNQSLAAFNKKIIHELVPSGTPNMAAMDPILAADDKLRSQMIADDRVQTANAAPGHLALGFSGTDIAAAGN